MLQLLGGKLPIFALRLRRGRGKRTPTDRCVSIGLVERFRELSTWEQTPTRSVEGHHHRIVSVDDGHWDRAKAAALPQNVADIALYRLDVIDS